MTNIGQNQQKSQGTLAFLRYTPALIFAVIGILSIEIQGISYYSLLITSFGIIPVLEIFLDSDQRNFTPKHASPYTFLLYLILLLHYFILVRYLTTVSTFDLSWTERIGITSVMGILCGVYGINVAHELGHRANKRDQFAAKILLLSSLYLHFFIEHNRGHHKRVATAEDPATARKDESVYVFWIRSVLGSYRSAFNLEKQRLNQLGQSAWSVRNEFLQYQVVQVLVLGLIASLSMVALLHFVAAALIGILLLETINYVEHYGLTRNELHPQIYSRVEHRHSWNSDHILGRYILFELTRHSDHHDSSSRTYPELRSIEKSPELPYGYPMMMLISLAPPLWKTIMNKRVDEVNAPSYSA
jgi:alkane 1-monooxygenase